MTMKKLKKTNKQTNTHHNPFLSSHQNLTAFQSFSCCYLSLIQSSNYSNVHLHFPQTPSNIKLFKLFQLYRDNLYLTFNCSRVKPLHGHFLRTVCLFPGASSHLLFMVYYDFILVIYSTTSLRPFSMITEIVSPYHFII